MVDGSVYVFINRNSKRTQVFNFFIVSYILIGCLSVIHVLISMF